MIKNVVFSLLLVLPMLLGNLAFSADKAASEAELKALLEKINQLKAQLKEAKKDQSQLEGQLESIDKQMAENNQYLNSVAQELDRLKKHLASSQKQRSKLASQKTQQQQQLESIIVSAYKQGKQPLMKVLLNQQNPQNSARQMKYLSYLNKNQIQQIEDFKQTLSDLEATIVDIESSKAQQQQKQQELMQVSQTLQKNKNKRQTLLVKLNNQIASDQSKLKKEQKHRAQLQKIIEQIAAQMSQQLTSEEMAAIDFKSLKGKMARPVNARSKHHFATKTGTGGLKWDGWLMPVKEGTAVKSIAHGRVIFADWINSFGLLIIVDHGDQYLSLYGRNQNLLRQEGQWVNAGETIALAGKSGGYDQSALYFEIRHNAKPQNPAYWVK